MKFPYQFVDQGLRKQALHKPANQRLEFLGDAVIGLFLAELTVEMFPKADEGTMSKIRAHLASTKGLAHLGSKLQVHLDIGVRGRSKGADSLTCDAVEALVGAVYLDGGPIAARTVVRSFFREVLEENRYKIENDPNFWTDPKTRLQGRFQRTFGITPTYEVEQLDGGDFRATVILGKNAGCMGVGPSKKEAELEAAEAELEYQERMDAREAMGAKRRRNR